MTIEKSMILNGMSMNSYFILNGVPLISMLLASMSSILYWTESQWIANEVNVLTLASMNSML